MADQGEDLAMGEAERHLVDRFDAAVCLANAVEHQRRHGRRTALLGQGGRRLAGADKRSWRLVHCLGPANPSVAGWARDHGLWLIDPGADLAGALGAHRFDYLFSITNLAIIPPPVLALPRRAAINFHDGPLPRYAGLHATTWALLRREATHGVTWHMMAERVDAGDILKQVIFDVAPDSTAFALNARCYEAAVESFAELVDELAAGSATAWPQERTGGEYFGKHRRPTGACVVAWEKPAEEIDALARALDFGPYPNPLGLPKLVVGEQAFIIQRLEALPTAAGLAPVWRAEVARLLPEFQPEPLPPAGLPDEPRLWEALHQFLAALARQRPVSVFLDDVQWADASSLALVNYLHRRARVEPRRRPRSGRNQPFASRAWH